MRLGSQSPQKMLLGTVSHTALEEGSEDPALKAEAFFPLCADRDDFESQMKHPTVPSSRIEGTALRYWLCFVHSRAPSHSATNTQKGHGLRFTNQNCEAFLFQNSNSTFNICHVLFKPLWRAMLYENKVKSHQEQKLSANLQTRYL